jgi:hypothetical protein
MELLATKRQIEEVDSRHYMLTKRLEDYSLQSFTESMFRSIKQEFTKSLSTKLESVTFTQEKITTDH